MNTYSRSSPKILEFPAYREPCTGVLASEANPRGSKSSAFSQQLHDNRLCDPNLCKCTAPYEARKNLSRPCIPILLVSHVTFPQMPPHFINFIAWWPLPSKMAPKIACVQLHWWDYLDLPSKNGQKRGDKGWHVSLHAQSQISITSDLSECLPPFHFPGGFPVSPSNVHLLSHSIPLWSFKHIGSSCTSCLSYR